MKKLILFTVMLSVFAVTACSSAKKTTAQNADAVQQDTTKTKPVTQEMNPEREKRRKQHLTWVQQQVDAYPDSLLISWERGSCYGRCPVYKVRIYKSGYTEYESVRWTDKEDGIHATYFQQEEIDKLLAEATAIGFYELDTFYDTYTTDLPSLFVYIHIDGKQKAVRDLESGPRKFKELITFMDKTLSDKSFTFVSKKE